MMPLQKPKAVYTASAGQYTASHGDVQVQDINEWRKEEQGDL